LGLIGFAGRFVGSAPELPGERSCAAAGPAVRRTISSAAQQTEMRAPREPVS
jgi:hypothetical protein